VLVVDDDQEALDLASATLNTAGAAVRTSSAYRSQWILPK